MEKFNSENPVDQLDVQLELEKIEVPLPEETIEAAVEKARAIARKLRARGEAMLTAGARKRLSRIADSLDRAVEEAHGRVNCIVLGTTSIECAEGLEDFADECVEACDEIKEDKAVAAAELVRLARKVARERKTVNHASVMRRVSRILGRI